jgi:integrase
VWAGKRAAKSVAQLALTYVSCADVAKVIAATACAEWRVLIGLARYAGLRVPAEALALKWSDVDWERNRLVVTSPKTEHHECAELPTWWPRIECGCRN